MFIIFFFFLEYEYNIIHSPIKKPKNNEILCIILLQIMLKILFNNIFTERKLLLIIVIIIKLLDLIYLV